jgi:hypothetical protein
LPTRNSPLDRSRMGKPEGEKVGVEVGTSLAPCLGWFCRISCLPDIISRASSQASAGIRLNGGSQPGDTWLVQISFRSGFVTHFYLSIPHADFQARLWVNSWTVEYSAILQCKPREVIWAYDAISFEFAF